MKTILKLFLLSLFLSIPSLCQTQEKIAPDCTLNLQSRATTGTSGVFDNRPQSSSTGTSCTELILVASATTANVSFTVVVQGAQDNGIANCVGCSWVTLGSLTLSAEGTITANKAYADYIRINLTAISSGAVSAQWNGFRANQSTTSSGGGVVAHVITDPGSVTAATLSAETTKVIGTVRIIGNAGAVLDAAGQNAASPANSLLTACQFNTSPTTISSGNISPVQCDNAGNTLVDLKTALPAGTNVIGHVIVDTAPSTVVTQGTNPWLIAGTGSAGSANAGVVTVQGIASMTPVQVSQATAANLNATVVGTGTFAVQATLAAETTKVIGTVRNVGNVGGIFDQVVGSAVPANALQVGYTDGTNMIVPYLDPCQRGAKSYLNINIAASARIITGTSAKKTYFCSFFLDPIGTATNVAVVEGTGSTCGTNTISVSGVGGGDGTAAKGAILAVNQGYVLGNAGFAMGQTSVNADDVCLLLSASNQISGGLTYVTF